MMMMCKKQCTCSGLLTPAQQYLPRHVFTGNATASSANLLLSARYTRARAQVSLGNEKRTGAWSCASSESSRATSNSILTQAENCTFWSTTRALHYISARATWWWRQRQQQQHQQKESRGHMYLTASHCFHLFATTYTQLTAVLILHKNTTHNGSSSPSS